jgi:hypothetical protein
LLEILATDKQDFHCAPALKIWFDHSSFYIPLTESLEKRISY